MYLTNKAIKTVSDALAWKQKEVKDFSGYHCVHFVGRWGSNKTVEETGTGEEKKTRTFYFVTGESREFHSLAEFVKHLVTEYSSKHATLAKLVPASEIDEE